MDNRLGELLVRGGLITDEHLQEALVAQRDQSGQRLRIDAQFDRVIGPWRVPVVCGC